MLLNGGGSVKDAAAGAETGFGVAIVERIDLLINYCPFAAPGGFGTWLQ